MNINIADKVKKEAKDLTVLYVEDEDDTRTQVSQILELFFKNVIIGIDGSNGLGLYKKMPTDLIMTDLTMPKINGLDMIRAIRKINTKRHVIVLTAHNDSNNLIETMNMQIDGFLLKPMKMDKMLTPSPKSNTYYKS